MSWAVLVKNRPKPGRSMNLLFKRELLKGEERN
jgi:hypothetical protein